MNLNYKLIISDLDGTLLDGDEIPASVLDAFANVESAGGYYTIATGRMYMSAARFLYRLKPNAPLILFNGALVTTADGPRELDKHTISPEVVSRTVNFCRKKKVYLNFFTHELVFSEMSTDGVSSYLSKDGIVVDQRDLLELLEEHDAIKLQLVGKKSELDLVERSLRQELGSDAAVARSEPYYLEIGPKGIHKGTAAKWVAQHLHVRMNDVLVVGDSMNDLPMLKETLAAGGLAVCVSNATEVLRALPGVLITRSNVEGGVGYAIDNFVFNNSDDLMEHYKLGVQIYIHQDSILQKRNSFLLAVNAALVAVAGLSDGLSSAPGHQQAANPRLLLLLAVIGLLVCVTWLLIYHRGGLYIRHVKAHLRFLETTLKEASLFTSQDKLFYTRDGVEYPISRGAWRLKGPERVGQQVAEHLLPTAFGFVWLIILFLMIADLWS